jgi:hypothetical protein
MRERIGGLGYFATSPLELAKLPLAPKIVFIVENLQTGLAFGDIPGAVIVLGHGYGLDFVTKIPWLLLAPRRFYWGDIDRDGLTILSLTRDKLPNLVSFLMDERTLLENRELWGTDDSKSERLNLNLTNEERKLFRDLVDNRFGQNVRLEQERLAWDQAWRVVENLI